MPDVYIYPDILSALSKMGFIGSVQIVDRWRIERALMGTNLVAAMEAAFVAWSEGQAQLAAVGELIMDKPPGEVHIKAGHMSGDPSYLVKIASGFYDNPSRGLPANSGLSLVFDAETGALQTLLLDEGCLTNERTAAAGAVAAKWLARPDARKIAVLGGGTQARLQLKHLLGVTGARRLSLWSRTLQSRKAAADEAQALGFETDEADTPAAAAFGADIIVTTTPSREPLLCAADISVGAHITAIGSDGAHKAELSEDLLEAADLIVTDSLIQCRERGELRRAGLHSAEICELGDVIAGHRPGRVKAEHITIADLTGLAAQDIAIARIVMDRLTHLERPL